MFLMKSAGWRSRPQFPFLVCYLVYLYVSLFSYTKQVDISASSLLQIRLKRHRTKMAQLFDGENNTYIFIIVLNVW